MLRIPQLKSSTVGSCCASSNSAALCAVGAHPENHHPRWVPPHALLAWGSVDGTTKMAAPSTQPPSGRPSEQGRRGRCFSTCHLAAHSASLCRRPCITSHNVGNEFGFALSSYHQAVVNSYTITLQISTNNYYKLPLQYSKLFLIFVLHLNSEFCYHIMYLL